MFHLLDTYVRRAIPFIATLVFVLLEAIRVPVPGFYMVTPAFALMSLYFWIAVRPEGLPAAAVFALGLVADIVSGAAFGTNVLLFLLLHFCMRAQSGLFRGNNFLFLWAGFAVMVTAVTLCNWAIEAMLNGPVVNPTPALARLVLSAIAYPLVHWMLACINSIMPKSLEA